MTWVIDDCSLEKGLLKWILIGVVVFYVVFEIQRWRDKK